MKLSGLILSLVLWTFGSACGPEHSEGPDPEEIIAAFCENLFECPETIMMLNYDSIDYCETIHRDDYEMRDSVCRERVLELEECLSELTCEELDVDQPCSDERNFLTERCHPL